MEKISEQVIQALPPTVREDATFWSHPCSTFFKVKFSSKASFLTALDYIKKNAIELEFEDRVDEITRPSM